MSSRINPGNTQDRTGGEHKKRQGRNGKNHEKNRKNQKKAMAFSGSSPVRPLGGTGCRTEPTSLRERCRLSFLPEVFYGGTVCVAMAYKKKQKENPRGRKSANRQVGGKGKGRRKRRPGSRGKGLYQGRPGSRGEGLYQGRPGSQGEGPVSRAAGRRKRRQREEKTRRQAQKARGHAGFLSVMTIPRRCFWRICKKRISPLEFSYGV